MTSYTTANTISDLFRDLFALLDEVAYSLLGFMYEILFKVAGADIFETTPDIIKDFYYRVQLIIGVFMVFKLAVSIIQGIINPDTFMDKKAGASSLIGRIVFALIMLVALAPINIPKPTNGYSSYQENLVNNGLLFGTIYELQDRILNNNTLGRLILGKHATNSNDTNQSTTQNKALAKQSDNFSVTILKGFIHINILETATSEKDSANHVCDLESNDLKGFKTVYDEASKGKTTPKKLLSIINADCTNNSFKSKGKVYAFTYIPIISTIMAGLFIYILLGEIITIAIRSLKLAVLRLLAPIPVISYIDPKSAKDGAFGSWVKALTSTYLELFIHLAVIYFIIYLIQSIISSPKGLNIFGEGIVGIFSGIFIFVGLFFFIKQAPKFIKDMLGIKGSSANVGLAGLLGGTAMLAGGGGLKGFALGAMQGTEAATQGYNQGKAVPLGAVWNQNSDLMAKIRTGDKDAKGGILGRVQDHLNYDTRERRARMLGIGAENYAEAKYIEDIRKAQAATTQEELDMAKAQLDAATTPDERNAAMARYQAAYKKNAAYQTALAKASKAADKMDKDRANFGVGPRISDSRRNKHQIRYQIHGDEYDEAKHDYILREGTYRSPLATKNDSKESPLGKLDYDHLPDTPTNNRTILGEVTGHKRDLKDFTGTSDDSTIGSGGHGAGGGPGHP